MRYRPFGRAGQTISVLTLALGDRPEPEAARVRLIYAALEVGVNGFEIRDPAAAGALGRALQALERRMVVIMLRLSGADRLDRDEVLASVEQPLLTGRLGRLDAVVVENPARLTAEGWRALEVARDSGRLRYIGVGGDGADDALARPGADLLSASHHLGSGWADRNRLKSAVEAARTVIGHGYHPELAAGVEGGPRKRGLFGLGRRPSPIEKTDGYAFLQRTPNWAADEICLAHTLTEPALASVVIEATTPEEVERLAAVTERDMAPGLAAQIEMARFAKAGARVG